MDRLLADACQRAQRYLSELTARRVAPDSEMVSKLAGFDLPLPEDSTSSERVLRLLDEAGSPATVATAGGRYFGFVTGGALPATVAASWLATAWDQNAGVTTLSPAAVRLEHVAAGWLKDVLGLPAECGVGFVTGATMANFTCLAAARHALLKRKGWDVEAYGLFGAPPITVVVSNEVHVSLLRALALLGLGRERVVRVPVDSQGRMRADALPPLDDSTMVCIQAGNVNTGAFDPAPSICSACAKADAWVHADGAFGLWANASGRYRSLLAGFEHCDSWATDCHKWLNVPYDSGVAIVRRPEDLRSAMPLSAAYIQMAGASEPVHTSPEMSRRARAIEVWAALLSLGRSGLAEMIERHCLQAKEFGRLLAEAGHCVLNEIVLNQVLVSFGSAGITRQVIDAVQQDGTCWCGGTEWQGQTAMRISVCGWATTAADISQSAGAIVRIARAIKEKAAL